MDKSSRRFIKLKLDQPAIMCSGRERVVCNYRGKILGYQCVGILEFLELEIVSYGKKVVVHFEGSDCVTPGWTDLKFK